MTQQSSSAGAAYKAERLKVYRRFHPDRGGSVEELHEALAKVDAKYAVSSATPQGPPNVYIYSTSGPWGVVGSAFLGLFRYLGKLPRRRTYFDI